MTILNPTQPKGEYHINHSSYDNDNDNRRGVIDAFNARFPIEDMLAGYGYSEVGNRWVRPGGSRPLVTILGNRARSYSTDDAICDGNPHDAFDLFRVYRHGGDVAAAVKDAAEMLGISHRQRAEVARSEAEQRIRNFANKSVENK